MNTSGATGTSSTTTSAYSTFRAGAGRAGSDAARVYRVFASQPSWVVKVGATLAALMVVAVTLLLIVPAVIVFVIVMIVGAVVERVRSLLPRRRGPVTDIEGRKNVRVMGPRQ